MKTTPDTLSIDPFERLATLRNWEAQPRLRMQQTIAPMRDLMARLGDGHKTLSAVHITGTKGKGSVCAMLESALHGAGLRVGRYTSPHIHNITERISLRCRPISVTDMRHRLETVLDARDQAALAGTPAAQATWFDIMTASAFLSFSQARLDWVIVETGIGGRLDSTNVLDARLCVITNVALEHTEVLGNSVEQIAREKAGIFKPGSRAVTGVEPGTAAFDVLNEQARQLGVPLRSVPRCKGVTHQNAHIAGAVLDELGRMGVTAVRSTETIDASWLDEEAIAAASLPGRLQRCEVRGPSRVIPVLMDGAHVDIALQAVLEEADGMPWAREEPVVLFALSQDKDAHRMLDALQGKVRHLVCSSLQDRPTWDAHKLASMATHLNIPCSVAADVEVGMRTCVQLADPAGWILVTGSLHLCDPALQAINRL